MSKKKDVTYKRFQDYIKNKDVAVNHYIDNYLTKTQSMFVYDGLPETIPQGELEHLLQTNGCCFVTEFNSKIYAFNGSTGGEPDEYNRPTEFIVSNPYLKLNKVYKIGVDGVLFKNDFFCNGLLPLIGKFAVLLTDSNISLNTATVLSRITMLISASDDKTKQSADLFLSKILDGDFSVIGESAFFDGVKLQTNQTANNSYLTQFVELIQYYKANLLNELGLNANYNMKRERLNRNEVAMNVDALLPFVDNMLTERQRAVESINAMFGTGITVDLGSSWKTTHEQEQQATEFAETDTETDTNDTGTDTNDTADTNDTDAELGEIEVTDETIEQPVSDDDKNEP